MEIDYKFLESNIPLIEITSRKQLPKELLLLKSDSVECWYAPLGGINHKAQIAFFGITPGKSQMLKSYEIFLKNKSKSNTKESLSKIAFYGSMRKNLIDMLNEIGLAKKMQVNSIEKLFGTERLAYSTVLKYPVFVNGKNYNGHSPKLLEYPDFLDILDTILLSELKKLQNVLIIPLGKSAFAGLQYVKDKHNLNRIEILEGFPHPSGANGHRLKQFEENFQNLKEQILNWRNIA